MERFVVREKIPASSAGTRRECSTEESTTEARSTASAGHQSTAKRSKPRPRPRPDLSGVSLHKESRSVTHGLSKRFSLESGSSSSLLHGRFDNTHASERRLDNLNFQKGQRKNNGNSYKHPQLTKKTPRVVASSRNGFTTKGARRNSGSIATKRSSVVATRPRVAFAAGLASGDPVQGQQREGSGGPTERVASAHGPPTYAENERPTLLQTVRSAQPTLRSERVTDFFPRVDRGLNLRNCGRGRGRPLGSTTWAGRNPPASQGNSNGGGNEPGLGWSTGDGGGDGEDDDDSSSRPQRRRRRSDVRIPEGDVWRGADDRDHGARSVDAVGSVRHLRESRNSRAPSEGGGIACVGVDSSMPSDHVSNSGVSMHRLVEREIAVASGFPAGPACVVAGSMQRSEVAERAAAAAEERRAAEGRRDITEENAYTLSVTAQAVRGDQTAVEDVPSSSSLSPSKVADGSGVVIEPTAAKIDGASPNPPAVVAAEDDETLDTFEVNEATQVEPPSPCVRQGGMSALFLTQRRSTGGRVGGAGSVGDAGQEAFRRQALSAMFSKGLDAMRLRMGRVAGSRVGAGVIRGTPKGESGASRITSGVSCLAFDSMGALLAAGGVESVTIYDFDEYVPQIPRVKSTLQNGVRAYLQPTHCIQTRRAVSCLRWNPVNEDQLAVSFLHYDEIDVFDLRNVLPDTDATPTLSLVAGSTATVAAGRAGSIRGRSDTLRDVSSRGGGGGAGVGVGVSAAVSRATGRNRGLGYLAMEFVSRKENGRDVTHLIAVGRGGAFRVWKFAPKTARCLAPYLQVQLGSNPRSRAYFAGCQPRPDVTAVCCLSADVALVGTDSGTLAAYSLRLPEVRAFQTGKVAERLQQWSLGSSRVWRHIVPGGGREGGVIPSEAFRIASLRPSPTHGPGVVVCGLRSGRVVVFDTRLGRALGITRVGVPPSVGFCDAGPYGGDWAKAVLTCSKPADGGEELLLLATSGRAALDRRRRDGEGRDSRLRPGPGWALGEAGGGGFCVQQDSGYGLCLPLDVQRAIPGEREVVLSRDARAYLCSREQTGLLRSRMVTSSVMIGREEYSVEDVVGDGREILLDRGYVGPCIGVGRGAARESARVGEALMAIDADDNVESHSVFEVDSTRARRRPTAPGELAEAGIQVPERISSAATLDCVESRKRAESTLEGRGGSVYDASPSDGVVTTPDRSWRPSGVRIFAKLRAMFSSGGENFSAISTARGQTTCHWGKASYADFSEDEEEGGPDGDDGDLSVNDKPAPPWSLLQVVGRAELGLPATAITSHPRMNFVLVGLSDGTVAAVLPGGKRKRRAAAKAVT